MLHLSKTILLFSLTMTIAYSSLSAMQPSPELSIYSIIKNSKDTPANASRVRELLSKGANANYKHEGVSLLNWAAHYDRPDIAKALLYYKADPNAIDKSKFYRSTLETTPLITAVVKRSLRITMALLDYRAKNRIPALKKAIELNATDICSVLIAYGIELPAYFPEQIAALPLVASSSRIRSYDHSEMPLFFVKRIINSRKFAKTFMLCLLRCRDEHPALRLLYREGKTLLKKHVLRAIVPFNKKVLRQHLNTKTNDGLCALDIAPRLEFLNPRSINETMKTYLHKDLGGTAQ